MLCAVTVRLGKRALEHSDAFALRQVAIQGNRMLTETQIRTLAAIQYGVHIVRANGKGITAFYDTRGNIRTQSNTFTSVAKVTFAEVPLTRVTTVYSVIGDRFVHVLLLFLLILTGLRFLKRVDI